MKSSASIFPSCEINHIGTAVTLFTQFHGTHPKPQHHTALALLTTDYVSVCCCSVCRCTPLGALMSGVPLDPEQQLANICLAGQLLVHISTLPQVSHSIRFHLGPTRHVPSARHFIRKQTSCGQSAKGNTLAQPHQGVEHLSEETGAHAAPKGKP